MLGITSGEPIAVLANKAGITLWVPEPIMPMDVIIPTGLRLSDRALGGIPTNHDEISPDLSTSGE